MKLRDVDIEPSNGIVGDWMHVTGHRRVIGLGHQEGCSRARP